MPEIDAPHHRSRWLVEFAYGDPEVKLRLTDWEDSYTSPLLGGPFTSLPEMEIDLPPNIGVLTEQPLSIIVPRTADALFSALTLSNPHAPVKVRVWEEMFSSTSSTVIDRLFHFRGEVSRAIKNYNNRKDRVKLEALSVKSKMGIPLGLPATSQCAWAFADHNCQVPSAGSLPQTATVTTIDRNTIEIATGLTTPGGDAKYWERGWMEFNGLRIGIKNSLGSGLFEMISKPPAAWAAQVVTVHPGCDKTIETCRARWANEEHFAGFGYGIPNYQPIYENPSL